MNRILRIPTPPPQPSHTIVCPDDWVGVGAVQQSGITTGASPTYGTIFWNGCQDVMYGAPNSWCKGQWGRGWNIYSDSSRALIAITGPRGNYVVCFQLQRDGLQTLGFASFDGFEYYCCSPP